MAAPGISFKAVGASLDTLAKRCQELPRDSLGALAYANSGVLQQAGTVLKARYIVPGKNQRLSRSGYSVYLPPSGATHGPVKMAWKEPGGEAFRNEKGQFQKRPIEVKLFKHGQFVDRSGSLLAAASELSSESPRETFPRVILQVETGQKGKRSEFVAGIDGTGNGYIELRDGYAAAEKGSRARGSNGVKGVWRSIRSVYGRWGTLLRKKFPDLLELRKQ